ncbi:hypothetical protein EJB05_18219, partial [Eragrostis curvula]
MEGSSTASMSSSILPRARAMEGCSSHFPLQALPWRGLALPPPAAPALAFVCSLCLLLHREQCGGPLCLLLPLSLLSSHMRVPYRLLCLAAAKLVSRWRDKRHAGDLNGNGAEKPLLDRMRCESRPGSVLSEYSYVTIPSSGIYLVRVQRQYIEYILRRWCRLITLLLLLGITDKSSSLLEWDARHAIALGIAKGLRFLHEGCRAGPVIHRDLRPSNVLLTHDFVPMLGDFGLAKWKTKDSIRTMILGQSGYLAPEYAEYGISSVKTDVYAFGVLLFQLISGRKVLDDDGTNCTHILTWAEPLVEILALHELIDDRIKDKYDAHGLYHLARAAYLCVRTNMYERPSMGEVVRLIDSENEHTMDCRGFLDFTK